MNIPHSLIIEPHEAMKRDFGAIINELDACGFSNCKIAYRCGVTEKTIRNWRNRKCIPPYNKAIIILGMHAAYCVPHGTSDLNPIEVQQTGT